MGKATSMVKYDNILEKIIKARNQQDLQNLFCVYKFFEMNKKTLYFFLKYIKSDEST
jgi:hypothetical protein